MQLELVDKEKANTLLEDKVKRLTAENEKLNFELDEADIEKE